MIQTRCFFACFRFLPSALLQHVGDTMASSRLKWSVQTGGRATAASTSSLATPSGKVAAPNLSATGPKTLCKAKANHSIAEFPSLVFVYCHPVEIMAPVFGKLHTQKLYQIQNKSSVPVFWKTWKENWGIILIGRMSVCASLISCLQNKETDWQIIICYLTGVLENELFLIWYLSDNSKYWIEKCHMFTIRCRA